MGREVRRVPPNWEHPKNDGGNYAPLFDETFDDAMQEWSAGLELWKRGKHEYQVKGWSGDTYPRTAEGFADYDGGPPQPEWCRPAFIEEPTWFQAYETVSEGTPVSPPFETQEELARYLFENGDFAYQKGHGAKPASYEAALAFVKSEYAPSMMMGPGGIKTSYELFPKDTK